MAKVFIGAAAGFAGDRSDAGGPVVDSLAAASGPRFLMYETLAERTLALCQLERRQNPLVFEWCYFGELLYARHVLIDKQVKIGARRLHGDDPGLLRK